MRPKAGTRAGVSALVGLATGLGVIVWSGAAVAHRSGADEDRAATLIEATHLPPLLTVPGEPVTLRYDIYCAPPGDDPGERRAMRRGRERVRAGWHRRAVPAHPTEGRAEREPGTVRAR